MIRIAAQCVNPTASFEQKPADQGHDDGADGKQWIGEIHLHLQQGQQLGRDADHVTDQPCQNKGACGYASKLTERIS